jgi:hypothetical protein
MADDIQDVDVDAEVEIDLDALDANPSAQYGDAEAQAEAIRNILAEDRDPGETATESEDGEVVEEAGVEEPEDEPGEEASEEAVGEQEEETTDDGPEGIDPMLLVKAGRLGFTDEELKKIGRSNEALAAVIEHEEARSSAGEDGKVEEDLFDLGLDPKEYDDEIIEAFQKIVNRYDEKIKTLTESISPALSAVESMSEAQAEQQKTAIVTRFDEELNKMKDMENLFGAKLPKQGTQHFKNREKAWGKFNTLFAAAQESGEKTTFEELVSDAVTLSFKGEVKKMSNERKKKVLNERRKRTIEPPSDGGTASGGDRLTNTFNAVAQEMRKRKMGPFAQ